MDAVFCFFAVTAMDTDDLYKPVEDSSSHALLRASQVRFHGISVSGMTAPQPFLELSRSFRIAKVGTRRGRMGPSKNETICRSAKAPAQYVVECVEVAPPIRIGNEHAADLVVKGFKRSNLGTVENIFLRHYLRVVRVDQRPQWGRLLSDRFSRIKGRSCQSAFRRGSDEIERLPWGGKRTDSDRGGGLKLSQVIRGRPSQGAPQERAASPYLRHCPVPLPPATLPAYVIPPPLPAYIPVLP
ncbi:hypothetical protein A6F68_01531 [Tsuneonella dongtanensis]|uniref:Uncharacterized protein n=1 Tax=Tsuneonella dongtanensis TaxID=692370 RepID=A0A1B2AD29_9SPHN|nr:hypothetical protein A6F68_01531 [Tsuneonella dongtanensis]